MMMMMLPRKKQALWEQVDCHKKERGSERGGKATCPVIIVEFQQRESRS